MTISVVYKSIPPTTAKKALLAWLYFRGRLPNTPIVEMYYSTREKSWVCYYRLSEKSFDHFQGGNGAYCEDAEFVYSESKSIRAIRNRGRIAENGGDPVHVRANPCG